LTRLLVIEYGLTVLAMVGGVESVVKTWKSGKEVRQ